MNYTDIYQKVAGLRRKAQPVKRVQTSLGGRESYRWESTMPEYLDKLAKEEFSDPQEQKLAALFWLVPEDREELANETAPGFLKFLEEQKVDTLVNARAAAIAFGCGWRPDGIGEELPWADAVAELAYVAIPLVRQAVNQLQGWGISFESADETDQLMWAQRSAEALCGNVDFEGNPYGKHQGTLHTFATKDCASIAFFTEKVRSSLWGYMSGRKITAEGFTSGILWHALRQEEAYQAPPQDRCNQGWIRFTEQLAICVSDEAERNGRSLASSNGPQNLQGSIEIRDLKPGEKISVGRRIYKAALFDKDAFYRVKGENCYEQKPSARTGNKKSYLWLRKGFDLPMLPLDDDPEQEWNDENEND